MAFMFTRARVRDLETFGSRIRCSSARTQRRSRESTCFVMRMTPTRFSSCLKRQDIPTEQRHLPHPQTCVRGCKNLAWSASQTSTSSTDNGPRDRGEFNDGRDATCPTNSSPCWGCPTEFLYKRNRRRIRRTWRHPRASLWLADTLKLHRDKLLRSGSVRVPTSRRIRGRCEDIQSDLPVLTSTCTRSCTVRRMSRSSAQVADTSRDRARIREWRVRWPQAVARRRSQNNRRSLNRARHVARAASNTRKAWLVNAGAGFRTGCRCPRSE